MCRLAQVYTSNSCTYSLYVQCSRKLSQILELERIGQLRSKRLKHTIILVSNNELININCYKHKYITWTFDWQAWLWLYLRASTVSNNEFHKHQIRILWALYQAIQIPLQTVNRAYNVQLFLQLCIHDQHIHINRHPWSSCNSTARTYTVRWVASLASCAHIPK